MIRGVLFRCQECGAVLPSGHATTKSTEDYCEACKPKNPFANKS